MKKIMDRYFLKTEGALKTRKIFNLKALGFMIVFGITIIIFGILLIPAGDRETKPQVSSTSLNDEANSVSSNVMPTYEFTPLGGGGNNYGLTQNKRTIGSRSIANAGTITRTYSASQLILPSSAQKAGSALPMGSSFEVKLKNRILSSDANSPIMAEVLQDVYWKNDILIPKDSKVIGSGYADEDTERLMVRFHTLVFPEGEQHSLQGLALMPDGSSGIPGELHSRSTQKQVGRFVGNFAAGVAQGFKDRTATGLGIMLEPGSIKNGLLNGVAQSSIDATHSLTDRLEAQKSYIEVEAGVQFLIYLEREFDL